MDINVGFIKTPRSQRRGSVQKRLNSFLHNSLEQEKMRKMKEIQWKYCQEESVFLLRVTFD